MLDERFFHRQKKGATEVALNALRARDWKKSALFALVRIFPDENSESDEEHQHQTDCNHSSDNHIIEEHVGLHLPAPVRWA
ncbi:hypothetical protein EMIT053CA3_160108 [Pseudomonas donghuensis]